MQIFLRILKYVKPYSVHLVSSLICILLFTFFSSATLISVIPFLRTIFHENPQQTVEQSEPSVVNSDSLNNLQDSQIQDFDRSQNGANFSEIRKGIVEKLNRFFIGTDRRKALARICLLILILIFSKSLFDYLQAYLMAHVEQGVIKDLRNDLYSVIIYMPLTFFHRTKTGSLISRITNDVTLINGGISASFVTLIKNPLLIVVYLSMALYISWQLTLTALVVLPFSLLIIMQIGLRLRKESTASLQKMAEVTNVLQETISGARAVKAFSMEQFEIQKFRERTYEFFRSLLKITRTRRLASPFTEFLGALVGVAILWFGGQKVLVGNVLPPEHFLTFLFVIFSMMQPIKELGNVNNRIQEAIAAGNRMFRILDLEPEDVHSSTAVRIKGFNDRFELKNISFHYVKHKPVLSDINLVIRKGQIIAIVGPSGVGKSTFVDLIPRFIDPAAGTILLDGTDLRDIELYSLRQLMGIVTQETILFHDTVRNNIAYGLSHIALPKIEAAAKAANAHDFILRLSNGYETLIGERGVMLSGGQRQRLAIARALLKNPPILILDEATSALDTESELLVQDAIERLMSNRTVFVIAHRLSTIQKADQIVVFENGTIGQIGKHQELMKKDGACKKLYNMQFRIQEVKV